MSGVTRALESLENMAVAGALLISFYSLDTRPSGCSIVTLVEMGNTSCIPFVRQMNDKL